MELEPNKTQATRRRIPRPTPRRARRKNDIPSPQSPPPQDHPPPSPPPTNQNRRRRQQRQQQNSSPPLPPSPRHNHNRQNYDAGGSGHNKRESLHALDLPQNATEREVRTKYRRLSMIYHPDKYSPSIGIIIKEATTHFQLLNNAYEFLCDQAL